MKYKRILYTLTCCLCISFVIAQPKQKQQNADSLNTGIAETELLQHQQQNQIDSIVKLRLKKELEAVSGNVQKTKELEAKLKQIAVADSLRKTEQLQKIEQLKKNAVGYPIVPFADTLFYLYTKSGSFKPNERAVNIGRRINALYDDNFFKPDSLTISENESGTDILYKDDLIIMSVTNLDALWFNKGSKEIAQDYLKKIKDAIVTEKKENSVSNWLKRIGLVALIIFGVSLLIFGINKLFKITSNYLQAHRAKYLNGITIKKFRLFTPEQHEKFMLRVNNILRIAVIIIALYLSLPLLFNVFPETQELTNTLLDWILTPAKAILNSIVNFLPNLFTILVIYFFTSYLVKAVKYFAEEIGKGNMHLSGFHKEFAKPTFGILRFILYAFMMVLIFPYLPGSDSPAFQGVSVFLGVLLSLGSSSAINNIIAGLVITYMRPFKLGDRVKIGDTIGDVIEKTMLVIRIRTIKNEDITVPNSTVLSSNTINYSSNANNLGLILNTTVTIGYDVPWKNMQQALINAALRTELILKDPAPFVLQTSLDDFYVSYQINAYTREANKQAVIYSNLHQNIQDCCNEAGIEIMSPHYSTLRDGNATTIPADYLPKDYTAPPFKVKQE